MRSPKLRIYTSQLWTETRASAELSTSSAHIYARTGILTHALPALLAIAVEHLRHFGRNQVADFVVRWPGLAQRRNAALCGDSAPVEPAGLVHDGGHLTGLRMRPWVCE
jgi:hypothetical protein